MHVRTHKWLLVMIALALAVAPLRGAWSISMPANTESTSHCAQMDMQTAAASSETQQQNSATESGQPCEHGCDGACCDGACNACAHGASFLSNTVNVTPELHGTPLDAMSLLAFPKRTVIPPLRPPASL
jgi:hypothetical protein